MPTAKEQFLASAGIREETFELTHNGARLVGVVRIHPARRYRELVQNISFEMLADQFLSIEDRTPLFTADEIDERLPDVFVEKLCKLFVRANTGRDPEELKQGEAFGGAVNQRPRASDGSSLPNWSEFGIWTRLKIAVRIVFCSSGKTI